MARLAQASLLVIDAKSKRSLKPSKTQWKSDIALINPTGIPHRLAIFGASASDQVRRPHPGAVRLALVALLLLGVGFLLREQVGPIMGIAWPMTAGGARAARHRHQRERAQSLGQALADVRAVPALGHVLRRRPAIQGMPICPSFSTPAK